MMAIGYIYFARKPQGYVLTEVTCLAVLYDYKSQRAALAWRFYVRFLFVMMMIKINDLALPIIIVVVDRRRVIRNRSSLLIPNDDGIVDLCGGASAAFLDASRLSMHL